MSEKLKTGTPIAANTLVYSSHAGNWIIIKEGIRPRVQGQFGRGSPTEHLMQKVASAEALDETAAFSTTNLTPQQAKYVWPDLYG